MTQEVHLCAVCSKEFAICDGKPTFGNGYGHDNVIKCSGFSRRSLISQETFNEINRLLKKV